MVVAHRMADKLVQTLKEFTQVLLFAVVVKVPYRRASLEPYRKAYLVQAMAFIDLGFIRHITAVVAIIVAELKTTST